MIGHEEIKEMKKGSFLINTSRGEVVNEKALIEGLKSGKILAAGVDVVCNEHNLNKKDNDLINYSRISNNLIITPHIAGLTIDSERKAQKAAFKACLKFFNME
jgi:lactate dehydrogenase-like 2-hydroxyacid dehydrogenase